jgi:hypothetical protein
MSNQLTLEEIKAKLQAASDEYDVLANQLAVGENGLPKNGAAGVCLHQASGAIIRALRALDDPEYTERLIRRQLAEHAVLTMVELRHPGI